MRFHLEWPPAVQKLLLTVLFTLTVPVLHAAEIKGTVSNAQGGEPLAKVKVEVIGTGFVTTTVSDGAFQFSNLPVGAYTLQVSAVGYRTLSAPFQLSSAGDTREFQLTLTPDNFRRTDQVEVHGDVFESGDFPSPGDMTLTSSELKETSTVIANDPFRSIQTMPGVSSSANDDFFAQFSVMGASFNQVGIYVDDVFVPNLIHSIAMIPDAPTLSLLTGNDVEEVRLMPAAYPVRYADTSGAALTIRTRSGSDGSPLFHLSVGLAQSDFLAEGGFSHEHKGTWLVDVRKSYVGYLIHALVDTGFSQDGFYDADAKFTYNLTPTQTFSFLATGGQFAVKDPELNSASDPTLLKKGTNNVLVTRLGWRWTPRADFLLDTHVAYVSTSFAENNGADLLLEHSVDREWSASANLSWNGTRQNLFQAGYTFTRPTGLDAGNFFSFSNEPPTAFNGTFADIEQNAYAQDSLQLWHDRVRVTGGVRWSYINRFGVHPVSGQFGVSFRATPNTTVEAGWGHYQQIARTVGAGFARAINLQLVNAIDLAAVSSQYLFAFERRLGERTRFRVEFFDRQNVQPARFTIFGTPTVLLNSSPVSKDYSRGVQFLLQRRSENRLSGWIGYTLTYARIYSLFPALPAPINSPALFGPTEPTLEDQRHTVNVFGTYRLAPSVRLSLKGLYGSGFPSIESTPALRIGPYERIDLRADKSWSLRKFKLSLYGEILNLTNHDNRRFAGLGAAPITNQLVAITEDGLPILPTIGLALDF